MLIIYEKVQNWNVIFPVLASKFKSTSQSQFLRIFTIPIYNVSWSSQNSIDNKAILLASGTPDSLSQFFPR